MTETITLSAPTPVGAASPVATHDRDESQPRILHVPGFLDMFLALSADTTDADTTRADAGARS